MNEFSKLSKCTSLISNGITLLSDEMDDKKTKKSLKQVSLAFAYGATLFKVIDLGQKYQQKKIDKGELLTTLALELLKLFTKYYDTLKDPNPEFLKVLKIISFTLDVGNFLIAGSESNKNTIKAISFSA